MWVLTWTGIHPHYIGGGPNMPLHDRQVLQEAVAKAQCLHVEAVDAQTERIYGIYEMCSAGLVPREPNQ
jgi:hypothetical protein